MELVICNKLDIYPSINYAIGAESVMKSAMESLEKSLKYIYFDHLFIFDSRRKL